MFFSPFSIAITSLGEVRANLCAFHTFNRFVLVWICRFPLPLSVWEVLRLVIVALHGLSLTYFYSTDRSKAVAPMLVLLFVALWFILRSNLFYVLPCIILFLCVFSLFSIAITSLGEERTNLSFFRMFVRFVLVWICRFSLPLDVWEGLRFVIVALPGLFSYLVFHTIPPQCQCLNLDM